MPTQSDRTVSLIKGLRGHLGLTQGDLASRSGLSAHVMANLESRRKKDMTLDELVALARGLGVSMQFLMGEPTEKDRAWFGERTWDALMDDLRIGAR